MFADEFISDFCETENILTQNSKYTETETKEAKNKFTSY